MTYDHPMMQTPNETTSNADYTDVQIALEYYLRDHATGDPEHMRQAFLPTAHIEGIREGTFTSWNLDEYCALCTGTPAADEATRQRRVDTIDLSGTVASAKATFLSSSRGYSG